MECAPHNWGGIFDHAVHFQVEPAAPNCQWFEMTVPQGGGDRPYLKDTFRVDKEGFVNKPTHAAVHHSASWTASSSAGANG